MTADAIQSISSSRAINLAIVSTFWPCISPRVSASRDLQIKEIKERKELRRKPGGFGRAGVLKNRRNQIKLSEGRIRI